MLRFEMKLTSQVSSCPYPSGVDVNAYKACNFRAEMRSSTPLSSPPLPETQNSLILIPRDMLFSTGAHPPVTILQDQHWRGGGPCGEDETNMERAPFSENRKIRTRRFHRWDYEVELVEISL
jgi:hypothetical protein